MGPHPLPLLCSRTPICDCAIHDIRSSLFVEQNFCCPTHLSPDTHFETADILQARILSGPELLWCVQWQDLGCLDQDPAVVQPPLVEHREILKLFNQPSNWRQETQPSSSTLTLSSINPHQSMPRHSTENMDNGCIYFRMDLSKTGLRKKLGLDNPTFACLVLKSMESDTAFFQHRLAEVDFLSLHQNQNSLLLKLLALSLDCVLVHFSQCVCTEEVDA